MDDKKIPDHVSRNKHAPRNRKANTTLDLLAKADSGDKSKWSTWSVIGDDGRRQVGQPGAYPFRTIMRVVTLIAGQAYSGTAFLVGPSTLLTAGHCLHRNGFLASKVEVHTAGGTRLIADAWDTLEQWKQTGNHATDLGFIRLNEIPAGALGHFGTQALAENEAGGSFAIAGYPEDRGNGRSLYCDVRPGLIFDGAYLRHTIDTEAGQSGAPLFFMSNKRAYAVGVHIRGDDTGQDSNRALRLTGPLIAQVAEWLK